MIEDYFESIKILLQNTRLALPPDVNYDRRDRETGFLRGDLVFKDGSRLHFREFVQIKRGQPANRYMYAFHYMRVDETMIFRYDDSNHFPKLTSAPHHKHIAENDVIAANAPDLQSVLKEIESLIDS
ncbi:MAG: DUF6516 family protein [Anaerolineales bacterium]|nr:DUF6516 family protein [Anaerolineales bacterium]